MTVIVLAKFVGVTTYLDKGQSNPNYEHGQYYVLIVGKDNGNNIEKQDGSSKVQYGSIRAFCANWTDIKQIKE